MMFDALGYPPDHPGPRDRRAARSRSCSWSSDDGGLLPALRLAGLGHRARRATRCWRPADAAARAAARARRSTGCGRARCSTSSATGPRARPDVRPGGWAFQYNNAHYPDVDDTAVVVMALHRADAEPLPRARSRAAPNGSWACRAANGGWGAFDADNTHYLSEQHPVRRSRRAARSADRRRDRRAASACWPSSAQTGDDAGDGARRSPICGASRSPTAAGSAAGAPTTSTAPGRCSCALNAAGVRRATTRCPPRRRLAEGDASSADGGWGEDCASYWRASARRRARASTASQTAWALLGLMAAGEVEQRGGRARHRLSAGAPGAGRARGTRSTTPAVGFPRVFYLRYHGYRAYFPLWALARYRNLTRGTSRPGRLGHVRRRRQHAALRLGQALPWGGAARCRPVDEEVAGADLGAATWASEALIARGATALLSFGIAGGLDPALRTGSPVVATAVATEGGERLAADPVLAARRHRSCRRPRRASSLAPIARSRRPPTRLTYTSPRVPAPSTPRATLSPSRRRGTACRSRRFALSPTRRRTGCRRPRPLASCRQDGRRCGRSWSSSPGRRPSFPPCSPWRSGPQGRSANSAAARRRCVSSSTHRE